ncbi:hypothetical protein [Gluconacetobacter diazotrophicus]|nr:hypothetical protein [Gluconacetobacter diazotrophicus]
MGALQRAAGEMSLRVWMETHREELLLAWSGRRLNWKALCEWFETVGLTNAHGEVATIQCAKKLWQRVGRYLAARKERAELEQIEAEARREALRAKRQQAIEEENELKARMARLAETAEWKRKQEAARKAASPVTPAPAAAPTAAPSSGPVGQGVPDGFVMLDLPRLEGVSHRAYRPVDPSLPPVREGEISPITGLVWSAGDDLPGYPSKRNYEYERDWLRDVGRLLRHLHPTNVTMTREEARVMRTAKLSIPNL